MQFRAMLLEVCVDSVDGVRAAAAAGADRVELCASLVEGGTTPSHGAIACCCAALAGTSTRLVVLIRPRGGDFMYSQQELAVMEADIAAAAKLGAQGVALGCLDADGSVDAPATSQLAHFAREHGLQVTFHRAFDMARSLSDALEVLTTLPVSRVLTSGGASSAAEGVAMIASLVKQARGRIAVLAGGGVTADNAAAIVAATGVRELHSSAKRRQLSAMRHRKSQLSLCARAPPSDWEWQATDGAEVARLVVLLAGLAEAAAPATCVH